MYVGIRGHGVGERLHASIWRSFEGVVVKQLPQGAALADTEHFDLAVIAVPPKNQLQTLDSLASRSDLLLCEKPCGFDVSDLSAWMGKTSTLVQSRVLINYQLRFLPDALLRFLRDGVDRTDAVSIIYRSLARVTEFNPGDWKAQSNSGGGVVISILSHLVDLLHFLGAEEIDFQQTNVIAKTGLWPNAACDAINVKGKLMLGRERQLGIVIDAVSDREEFQILFGPGADRQIDLLSDKMYTAYSPRGRLRSDLPGPWRNAYVRLAEAIRSRALYQTASLEVCAKPVDALRVQAVLTNVLRSAFTKNSI